MGHLQKSHMGLTTSHAGWQLVHNYELLWIILCNFVIGFVVFTLGVSIFSQLWTVLNCTLHFYTWVWRLHTGRVFLHTCKRLWFELWSFALEVWGLHTRDGNVSTIVNCSDQYSAFVYLVLSSSHQGWNLFHNCVWFCNCLLWFW